MPNQRKIVAWISGLLAVIFGVMTLRSGGLVLFGPPSAREAAGDYVPFVVWFNFSAGFLYILAGLGLALRRRGLLWLAGLLAGSTVLVFDGFGWHVLTGGAYETRTVIAMTGRSVFWMIMTGVAWFVRETEQGG